MSLNHFTNCNDDAKNSFQIGAVKLCATNIEAENQTNQSLTTNSLIIKNADNSETNFSLPNQGTASYVLHTDGVGGVYWGPDDIVAGGITYNGTQPAPLNAHLKIATNDGSQVVESKLIENATELNLQNLKIINLSNPVNNNDGVNKQYVDNLISGNVINKQTTTGVYSGGHITKNTNTTFDISDGDGIINNNGVLSSVSWSGLTNIPVLNGQNITYVQINNLGQVIKTSIEPTEENNRDNLFLGKINTPDMVNIDTIDEHIYTALNVGNSLIDLTRALGHINLNGNVVSKGSALMSIQKTEGHIYAFGSNFSNNIKQPSNLFLPLIDTATGGIMKYYMKNGNVSSALTTINPNYYDNGTNYPGATVQTNEWTVQRVFSSSSSENYLHVMLGQYVYVQKQDAINAISTEVFEVHQELIDDDVLLGYIVVRQGTTDLSNAEFIKASKFSGVGGSGSAPAIDLSKIANFTTASQLPDITNLNGVIRNDGTLPTNNNDLTSKLYVDNAVSGLNYVSKTGDIMSGNLDMNANYVLSSGVPSLNTHLTNKLFVDGELLNKLNLSGGTMTGNINMNSTNNINNVNQISLFNTGGFLTNIKTSATSSYNFYLPINDGSNGQVLTTNGSGQLSYSSINTPYDILVSCSDETTALTSGTGKVSFRIPRAFTLSNVKASLTTAQTTGSIFTVDINLNNVSILSTKLTIDNTETTSTTAVTPAVISNTNMTDDGLITVDIDQLGTGATGLKVCLIGTL